MSEAPPAEDSDVSVSDTESIERNVIKSSTGPDPFPGIPQLSPRRPPEAGQVLLRFDVEEVRARPLARERARRLRVLALARPLVHVFVL